MGISLLAGACDNRKPATKVRIAEIYEADPARASVAPVPCGPFRVGAKRADLLAGRLTIAVLESGRADDVPRPHDVMSAPPPAASETRLRAEDHGATFVALANERFQMDPGSEARTIRLRDAPYVLAPLREQLRESYRWPGEEDLTVERIIPNDSRLRLYLLRPWRLSAQADGGTTLATAAVVFPDGTIATVRILVDVKTATGSPDACSRFAEAILATLAKGPRDLDLAEGDTRLAPTPLTIRKPRDTVVVHQRGPDFDTFQLHRVTPLGLPGSSLAIILDRYLESPPPAPEVAKGFLGGQPITWFGELGDEGGRIWARGTIPGFHTPITLSAAAPERREVNELRRVAESLRRIE